MLDDARTNDFLSEIRKILTDVLKAPEGQVDTQEPIVRLEEGVRSWVGFLDKLVYTGTKAAPSILATTLGRTWVLPDNGERAAMLAILGQILADTARMQEVPVGQPGDNDSPEVQQRNFKKAADRHADVIQQILELAITALMLTGGTAVGAKKFDEALPKMEAAVKSFVEAQDKLDRYRQAVKDVKNYDTIIKRIDLKIVLNDALWKIDQDLCHVKAALAKVC